MIFDVAEYTAQKGGAFAFGVWSKETAAKAFRDLADLIEAGVIVPHEVEQATALTTDDIASRQIVFNYAEKRGLVASR